MKEGKIFRYLILLFFLTLSGTGVLQSISILKTGIMKVSEGEDTIKIPRSFCVTDDGIFIFLDYKAGDIKIYEQSGENLRWMKTIGKKGLGKEEFQKPAVCCFDVEKQRLAIIDYGNYYIFIFERTKRLNFKLVNKIYLPKLGSDLKFWKNELIVAGTNIDSRNISYELYSIDLKKKNSENVFDSTYLIPAYEKYGLSNPDDFNNDYIKRSEIGLIGINGFFDIYGKDIYYTWEGDLRILKFNIDTERLSVFGMKTENYIKPYFSVNSLEVREEKTPSDSIIEIIRIYKSTKSYVRNVFVTSSYVLVIIEGPNERKGNYIESNFWMQVYTLNGTLISEKKLPDVQGFKPNQRLYFDKITGTLYSLIIENNRSNEGEYYIIKYKLKL